MVKIGISIPTAYLAGQPDKLLSPALGTPDQCLKTMAAAGVQFIEFRAYYPSTDPSQALAAMHRVCQSGLGMTVHGQLPERPANPGFIYPALLPICQEARDKGQQLIIVVHCFQSTQLSAPILADQTEAAARELLADARRQDCPVRLALEINRARDINDPGTSYQGLLDLSVRLADPRVGICWDMGHAYSNVLQGKLDIQPPRAYLEQVIHTHIHALSPQKKTHWPLNHGELPLLRWLQDLAQVNYDGVLCLELDMQRFASTLDCRDSVLGSIALLIQTRDQVQASRPGNS